MLYSHSSENLLGSKGLLSYFVENPGMPEDDKARLLTDLVKRCQNRRGQEGYVPELDCVDEEDLMAKLFLILKDESYQTALEVLLRVSRQSLVIEAERSKLELLSERHAKQKAMLETEKTRFSIGKEAKITVAELVNLSEKHQLSIITDASKTDEAAVAVDVEKKRFIETLDLFFNRYTNLDRETTFDNIPTPKIQALLNSFKAELVAINAQYKEQKSQALSDRNEFLRQKYIEQLKATELDSFLKQNQQNESISANSAETNTEKLEIGFFHKFCHVFGLKRPIDLVPIFSNVTDIISRIDEKSAEIKKALLDTNTAISQEIFLNINKAAEAAVAEQKQLAEAELRKKELELAKTQGEYNALQEQLDRLTEVGSNAGSIVSRFRSNSLDQREKKFNDICTPFSLNLIQALIKHNVDNRYQESINEVYDRILKNVMKVSENEPELELTEPELELTEPELELTKDWCKSNKERLGDLTEKLNFKLADTGLCDEPTLRGVMNMNDPAKLESKVKARIKNYRALTNTNEQKPGMVLSAPILP